MSAVCRCRSFSALRSLPSTLIEPKVPMFQCGAFDKLSLNSLSRYHSLPKSCLRFFPVTKVPVARGGSDRFLIFALAMNIQRASTKIPPNVDIGAENMKSQGDTTAPKSGWRPYQGRWNAKVPYRDSGCETRGRETSEIDNYTTGRGRPRQNQRRSNGVSNGTTKLNNGQPGRSLSPRRDSPSQHQWQNGPNVLPANNDRAEFPMMNTFPMFGGFPFPTDPSLGFPSQVPFFTPNISEQMMQPQLSLPLDQSLLNPPFFLANMPPLLPPAAFMGLALQSQTPPEPMLNAPGQMGTVAEASFIADAPLVQNPKLSVPLVIGRRQASRPPRPPSATGKYLHQSSLSPQVSPHPQPLLVILDLNGTLIYRKSRKFPPSFTRRAGLEQFLNTLVEKYKVMIWSSSQPQTVDAVCQKLFPEPKRKELVAEWGRDKLGLSKSEYNSKIQVYKTLETVWSSKQVQATYPQTRRPRKANKNSPHRWDQTNTILIDDSKLKALSEPYNLIEIPEFTSTPGVDDSTIFPKVLQHLEILAKCDDVSKLLHLWNFKASGTSILDLDLGSTTLLDLDPAQARKARRKAHKQEKKAARRAAAVAAAKASYVPSSNKPSSPPSSNNQPQQLPKSPSQSERESSPSSASSVKSENYLLDRLEESLH